MAKSHLLIAAMVAAVAAPASAANYVVNAVINSGTLAPFALNNVAIDPITLEVGDTLELNLTFSGGRVTIGGGGPVWTGVFSSDTSATITTTSTMAFIGNSANIVPVTSSLTAGNAFQHVGNIFNNALYQTAPGSVSFTGLNQSMSLDSDNLGRPRSYNLAFFYFETSVEANAVPEPASWAMLIAGFGLVGAVARRRRPMTLA